MGGPSGLINLDKPCGATSHGVVQKIRKLLRVKKVGHGGTLDPAATGVLPVLVGDATRLMEFVSGGEKTYQAVVRLGAVTDTQDAQGRVLETRRIPGDLTADRIEALLPAFTGQILQDVPAYAAVRQEGRRRYELARRGASINHRARQVTVHSISLTGFAPPDIRLEITCGKGTYIRQLASDLGAALECGAHLAALRRTRVADLRIDDALTLESIEHKTQCGKITDVLLPMWAAVQSLPRAKVTKQAALRLANGQRLPLSELVFEPDRPAGEQDLDPVAVIMEDGELVALIRVRDAVAHPFRVFASRLDRRPR